MANEAWVSWQEVARVLNTTYAVHETACILLGMPLPAATAAKHSCARTAEVKILHWGTAPVLSPESMAMEK